MYKACMIVTLVITTVTLTKWVSGLEQMALRERETVQFMMNMTPIPWAVPVVPLKTAI